LPAAEVLFDPLLEPDEFFFMYIIEIVVDRRNADLVLVYSVSLQDVL